MPSSTQLARASNFLSTKLQFSLMFRIFSFFTSARFRVKGNSMEPSLSDGEYLLVTRTIQDFVRGDVVMLHDPDEMQVDLVKRIVGLPGESITCNDGNLEVDGFFLTESYVLKQALPEGSIQRWELEEDQYLVLGDRRDNSRDSRHFGPISCELIVGRAWFRYWPYHSWGHLGRFHRKENNSV